MQLLRQKDCKKLGVLSGNNFKDGLNNMSQYRYLNGRDWVPDDIILMIMKVLLREQIFSLVPFWYTDG